MPRYQITAPDGRVVTVEGDNQPTQEDATTIFAQLPPKATKGRPKDMLGGKAKPALAEVDEQRGIPGFVADVGLEAGGAMTGQAVGAIPVLSVPTGGLSIPIGGAIGGTAGNLASQKRRILAGEQKGYRPGEALASFFTGMIPGASLEASGGKAIAREALKQGAAGVAGRALETMVDEGRLPSAGEAAVTAVLPAIGGGAAQRMQAASPAIQGALREAEAGSGAVARATLKEARDAGYVIPQSLARQSVGASGSLAGDTLESFGGKAATLQEASLRNQKTTNSLAKKALGLPENRDITEEAIDNIRVDSAKPYAAIEEMATKADVELKDLLKKNQGLNTHETEVLLAEPGTAARRASLAIEAAADVDALRKARNTATGKFRQYKRSADPSHLEEAENALATASALEQKIEDAAMEFGKPEMVQQLRDARTRIAKTYDVEKALNKANSNVDANVLAASLKAGRPLSAELETIAKAALQYAPIMKEVSKVGAPGVSAFQIAGMLGGAFGGTAAMGPYGALAGAAPLARPGARALALSEPYQNFATRIPLSVDARRPARALATRVLAQEGAQELADEVEPKKKK